jgi:hypothetical protein
VRCGEIGKCVQGFSKTKMTGDRRALINNCTLRSDPLLCLFVGGDKTARYSDFSGLKKEIR